MAILDRFPRCVIAITLFLTVVSAAQAKYSGGIGEPNDPYQIATAADLIALGETPGDYDKHFILTADIDLDPSLPGRKVFDKAVIAPDTYTKATAWWGFDGTPFTGVFDGNGRSISHLTIATANYYVGLFGILEGESQVKNLGMVDVQIRGSDTYYVGGLVGMNLGTVTGCSASGTVSGGYQVGGLVGYNGGIVTQCYSTGAVTGNDYVGGLVGSNGGIVTQCYSTGMVSGMDQWYSGVGGLVSTNDGSVVKSIWDTQTSGLLRSSGGVGLTTAEMMDPQMLGLNGFSNDPNWVLDAGRDYPRLAWEGTPGSVIPEPNPNVDWLEGLGTSENPYRIETADQLVMLSRASTLWNEHFVLSVNINLDPNLPGGQVFAQAVIQVFTGVFDGNGHTISHLTVKGEGHLGLLGRLQPAAEIRNLAMVDVKISGSGDYVGGLVGRNLGTVTDCSASGTVSGYYEVGGLVGSNGDWQEPGGTVASCSSSATVRGSYVVGGLVGENGGSVTQCHSTGVVRGGTDVGGLAGNNWADVKECYSTGAVTGNDYVGGLVGTNGGNITTSHSDGSVNGDWIVGGLVGDNHGTVIQCYSTGAVTGNDYVGGLVGRSSEAGATVTQCYSVGTVRGKTYVGGLVGLHTETAGFLGDDPWEDPWEKKEHVANCFWDTQSSGQTNSSVGGIGKTTAEMQTAKTFLDAGWDFVGETANGTSEIWQMQQGGGYPVLAVFSGYAPPPLEGTGTAEDPYLIHDALELGAVVHYSPSGHYRLAAPIELFGIRWSTAVIPRFAGTFDGNGYEIANLTIQGGDCLGLFGQLDNGANVKNLGVVDVNITGLGEWIGGLVGNNGGIVTRCYSTGLVSGSLFYVGGLVGNNGGTVTRCYSTGSVSGSGDYVGGLVGLNWDGTVTQCYSTGPVTGSGSVGGLVGSVGVGDYGGVVAACFWDTQTSGCTWSDGGEGQTTAEMQTANTFLEADWDFVDETANGTDDIWWILEGQDYPRLWWEGE